eukprot:scaffold299708_cov32-Tisochrysis_lutea.AAC.2
MTLPPKKSARRAHIAGRARPSHSSRSTLSHRQSSRRDANAASGASVGMGSTAPVSRSACVAGVVANVAELQLLGSMARSPSRIDVSASRWPVPPPCCGSPREDASRRTRRTPPAE